MSQEHPQPKPDTLSVSDGIHPEAAPFEHGYQPETLPHLHVPDLADDAQGLSAEALAQVPTLTELVNDEASHPTEAPAESEAVAQTEPVADAAEPEPEIQEPPVQADTWGEQLQARMGKLSDDIHTLNARLDRLDERNKTKV